MGIKNGQTKTVKTAKKKSTQQKKQKKRNPLTYKRIIRALNDERFKFFLGLGMIFLSLYLLLAFISYLFTWKIDQSVVRLGFIDMLSNDEGVENWMGKVGAYLSNLFVHDWFGLASFGFVFIIFITGFRLLKIKLLHLGKSLRYTILGVLWFSVTLAYLFRNDYFSPGGAHGYVMNNWLNETIGKTGTAFLLIGILIAFVLFTFDNSVHWLRRNIAASSTGETDQNLKNRNNQHSLSERPEPKFILNRGEDDQSVKSPEKPLEKSNPVQKHEKTDKNPAKDQKVPEENEQKITQKASKTGSNSLFQKVRDLTVGQKQPEDNIDTRQHQPAEKKEETSSKADDILKEPPLTYYDPTLELPKYQIPPLDLLEEHKSSHKPVTNEELIENKNNIVNTLKHYNIEIQQIKATIGPTVTLYEIIPVPGVRISKIKNLEDDIALSLAALGIRIIAPMPGRGTIGIEVPNSHPEIVAMRSVVKAKKFSDTRFELPIALGKTISNETFVFDLTKMPHLLVAGATGQGKSVGLNVILTSLIYKKHPAEVKFVLVDPKKVELTLYEKIEKHYLAKLPDTEEAIITDNQQVIKTLGSLTVEMTARYELLKKAHVRNIKEYNAKFRDRRLNPEKGHRFMPYIILVVDEFADLIMTAGKEIEMPVARLAQLARAVGIHLIVATQRPSTNIITGVIKANFPARIAFKVASMIDSRTILDSPGANQLIGRGDLLMTQGSELIRIQCAFVDTPELEKITDFIHIQKGYTTAHLLPEFVDESEAGGGSADLQKKDSLFEEAARLVVLNQQGSTSLIQRKMSIGYNRAGRIMDQLEAAGIVGPAEGSKPRQVLYQDELSLEQLFDSLN
jgi:DNA segregation ATPase FtsK/SpoIIIE, S-DNA-T family